MKVALRPALPADAWCSDKDKSAELSYLGDAHIDTLASASASASAGSLSTHDWESRATRFGAGSIYGTLLADRPTERQPASRPLRCFGCIGMFAATNAAGMANAAIAEPRPLCYSEPQRPSEA